MTDSARFVPGTIDVPGRRFVYIQDPDPGTFQRTFNDISSAAGSDVDLPSHGGMISENTVIVTPAGEHFCGVSFKGDIAGWQAVIDRFASSQQRKLLWISGADVELSDGSSWPLARCQILPYEVNRRRRRRK